MTRFDIDENFNSRNSTEQHDSTHAALLQAGFMEVADKKQKGGDKATTNPAGKNDDSTPSEKILVKAAEAFQKSDSPESALKASSALFEQSISQADKDFETTTKEVGAKAKELAPQAQMEQAKVQAAAEKADHGLQAIPEADRAKAQKLGEAYLALDKHDHFRGQMEKRMAQWPEFGAAMKEWGHLNTPALDGMKQLEIKFGTALNDRILTRMTYAEALAAAGKTDDAQKYVDEARKIAGLPEDENHGRPLGNGPRMYTATLESRT